MKTSRPQTREVHRKRTAGKNPWATPRLTRHGDIAELTRRMGTYGSDGYYGSSVG